MLNNIGPTVWFRVKSTIWLNPLHQFPRSKSVTSWRLLLKVCNGFWNFLCTPCFLLNAHWTIAYTDYFYVLVCLYETHNCFDSYVRYMLNVLAFFSKFFQRFQCGLSWTEMMLILPTTSGGSTLQQGLQLHPQFSTMHATKIVPMNNRPITLLCRLKHLRIRNLLGTVIW